MHTKTDTKEPTARFLRACYGLEVDATPIWLMRQAGRYMREYQQIRSKRSMLEVIFTPELAAEVTLQPITGGNIHTRTGSGGDTAAD